MPAETHGERMAGMGMVCCDCVITACMFFVCVGGGGENSTKGNSTLWAGGPSCGRAWCLYSPVQPGFPPMPLFERKKDGGRERSKVMVEERGT